MCMSGGLDWLVKLGDGGPNTGDIVIDQFRAEMDGHANHYCRFVDGSSISPGGSKVTINNLRVAGGPSAFGTDNIASPVLVANSGVNIAIRDSFFASWRSATKSILGSGAITVSNTDNLT